MRHVFAYALLLAVALAPVAGRLHAASLQVHGTALRVSDPEGNLIPTEQLIGAELDLADRGTVRVLAVERDSTARFGPVWLHSLEIRIPGTDRYTGFCEPDPAGDRRVVLYPGYVDGAGDYVPDAQRFSMSCVSGVEAKCLRWGYLPWRQAPTTGESLAPYFEACIKLARADYCGDNHPSTRNGTTIDVYDRVGVQTPEADPGELSFEAGWSTEGAVCVARTRIPDNLTLTDLAQQCPRLATDALGANCSEDSAHTKGAILFNRSR